MDHLSVCLGFMKQLTMNKRKFQEDIRSQTLPSPQEEIRSNITGRSSKELPQQQLVNWHYEFSENSDSGNSVTDCNYTCKDLITCSNCVQISNAISAATGVGVIATSKVVAVQPLVVTKANAVLEFADSIDDVFDSVEMNEVSTSAMDVSDSIEMAKIVNCVDIVSDLADMVEVANLVIDVVVLTNMTEGSASVSGKGLVVSAIGDVHCMGGDEANVPREVLPNIQNGGHPEGDLWNPATFRGNVT
ncbi:hypothetical protein CR513_18823, partial [Mucuna pruriens]